MVGACGNGCGEILLQLLVYGLTNGALVALNAVGFTITYGVSRQINLAHGNVFALTTVVVATAAGASRMTSTAPITDRVLVLVGVCLLGAVVGAVLNWTVERLAFRPFRARRDPLGPLIASVALSFVLLQTATWWYSAYFVAQPGPHQGVAVPLLSMPDLVPSVDLGTPGVAFSLKDLLLLVAATTVAGGIAWLLARARSGRLLRAVAEDPELVGLSGGDPARAQSFGFALGGAITGLAAAIFTIYYGGDAHDYGLRGGLSAMTAAVLGGVGQPGGALAAGVWVGLISAYSDFFLDARWTPVIVLVLLVLALAFRPNGLLTRGAPPVAADPRFQTSGAAMAASHRLPRERLVLAALLLLGLAFPLLDAVGGWSRLPGATATLQLVILALGLSLVVSYTGLLDMGYAAFFAIGGYTAGLLTGSGSRLAAMLPEGLRDPWLALLLAGVAAMLFGVLFGLPTIRTRGEYLAIVTLAFGEIVPTVIGHLPEWTGGARGMTGIPMAQLTFLSIERDGALQPYLLAFALAVVAYLVAARLVRSRAGRAWAAVRDDEVAATSVGIRSASAKLLAFALGAGFAGIAGAAFAGQFGHVEPQQFDFTLSLMALASVVIGGRWGLPGAVLGALAVAAYDRLLLDALTGTARFVGWALSQPWLEGTDLRAQNFGIFGAALYLATLLRVRGENPDGTS